MYAAYGSKSWLDDYCKKLLRVSTLQLIKLSPKIYGDTSHQRKRPHKLLDQELLKNRVGYPQPGSGIIQIT